MRRRWLIMSLVFAGIVINYVDRGNLSIAAPSIMHDFRIGPATMGILLSAFFWTYAVCQIPAGALVDKIGIRGSYAAGFLVWSIASASIALCRGPGGVISTRLVLGLAESTAPLASIAFIRNSFAGKDQGLPTAIYIAGQNIGPALGALVGALLIDRFGWRMMFAITGLGALVWVPCWLAAVPAGETRAARVHEEMPGGIEAPRTWTWRMLVADKTFWAMPLAMFFSSYFWFFVLTWIPGYLILSRGFSTLAMGKIVSIALFTMAGVNVLAGWVVDRVAARAGVFRARLWFAVVGYVGTASILLLLVTGRTWVLLILTFAMCATGIGNSNYWAISQHVPPKHLVGRTIGFLNTVAVLAGATAPIITGWLLGPNRHFGPAIFVAGICAFLAAVCLVAAGSQGLERMKATLSGGEALT
jgi:MFS transporter, ACS family, D-galactonate transporter